MVICIFVCFNDQLQRVLKNAYYRIVLLASFYSGRIEFSFKSVFRNIASWITLKQSDWLIYFIQ